MKNKLLAISIIGLLLVGCFIYYIIQGNTAQEELGNRQEDSQLRVVTTTTQITDLVKILGGETLIINGLMGAGIDPHSYQATEGDVKLLQEADIIFYNGLHLEGKMDDLFEEMRKRGISTYAITDALDTSKFLEGEDDYEGSHDPHIWFDATLWMEVTTYVGEQLAKYDPENETLYRRNVAEYLKELTETHQYVLDRAFSLPKEQRVLVTAHDAFQYFGRAYDFKVEGIEGISTESEAGIADIRELADYISKNKIKAIFVESSVPRRNVEALQQAVRARGFNVSIGGEIFSDAMGNPETYEGTYVGMMRYNIDTIVDALKD
ncbi:metal ABC transporter solute-binding protein, Zn/Mn family [Alkaliphilus transvaalensis]|uniref:metal ABC transporter solute-binding protein, Zn/Mn family n=1 Tax=Alkaliphilus transvaalensis TaxID=114628 RepID=UPI0004797F51|nr:zinc ABC transporter substrate-binding protein [Alkaliphilus transvaalensis]